MIRAITLITILLSLQLLPGCSGSNLPRGIYEGVRVRNDLRSSPSERLGRPDSPDYQEYERLRKEKR